MDFYHTPVLLAESLDLLDIQADGVYVDLTFGGGGHSIGILERLGPQGRLFAFDQDAEAAARAVDDPRFTFVRGNFRFMRGLLREKFASSQESANAGGKLGDETIRRLDNEAIRQLDDELTQHRSCAAPELRGVDVGSPQPPEGGADGLHLQAGKPEASAAPQLLTPDSSLMTHDSSLMTKCLSPQVDGILADLGVSSRHFDSADRGFSFRADGPLDMRMNRGRKLTAADVVNGADTKRLIEIFRDYGELPDPHKIAGRIAQARREAPIQTTAELVEIVRPLTPKKDENRYLSQLFQALRIEVNGEMEALRMMLEQSLKVLRPGGRLVVISYHSLEDRTVKNFMRPGEKDFYGRAISPWSEFSRKAVVPGAEEIERNPRSRSAKLRYGVKDGR